MVRRVRDSDPNCALIQAALNHSVVERREIQLHADVVGIVEDDLRLTTARHDLLAELHIPGLQALPNTVDVGCGKGDMVQAAGVVELLLGAAHHDALARLALPHQMHGSDAAGIEPIARKVERRTVAVLQPKHVAMEVLGAFQIGGLDGVMLQGAE
jgi:hypothetical protein